MVAMAAMETTQSSPAMQGRAVSVSVDSLDVVASSHSTGAQGAAASTPSGAADSLAVVDPADQDEKVVKVELANLSAATSKEDIDDEDGETADDLETVKTRGNAWAAKKTVAQGMMDIALLTSNANQLRYLIMYGKQSSTYVISITLIAISILLQVAVGVVLIFKGKSDLKGEEKKAHANKLNNYVVVGVFLVTIINVFAASFSDVSPAPASP
ncbi:ninjurin-1-like [Schistocerca serialis cubense]|uniref:ninjurin-1-like n=1 Tax=Schistocerca serialis cubense TaxID=2023355 RepID=UPI00214EA23C|nr:ninjurin-1-like [Schistocerca serialis cubense]XP_049947425.1 ninjurin-1-like [Schistocerca serialis cubense]